MRFAELASEMVTDPALLEELNALLAVKMRGREFSLVRGYHHYVSMARKNLREHLLGEVVRQEIPVRAAAAAAARWIQEGRGAPPCASPSWRARW